MDSRKLVFQETAVLLIGQIICIGAMCGVYALLKLFSLKVLFGGIVGGVLALVNFFLMAIGVNIAADKAEDGDVKGGQNVLKLSQAGRYLLMAVVLIAVGVSGIFDLIATVLPLIFVRPIISIGAFFSKGR